MASFPKTFVTSSLTQFPQHQTSGAFIQNQRDLTSTFTEKSSISNSHTFAYTSLDITNNPIVLDDRSINDDIGIELAEKLKALKDMLCKKEDAFEGLAMIDAIQRLGIEYLFQKEIDLILLKHYMIPNNHDENNLYEVALRFRLLRQEGYNVPAGVFQKFTEEGKFNEKLSGDIKGLMGLYEASQLSVKDDDILDEAGEYSYRLLKLLARHLDYNEAKALENSLKHPYYKSIAKFMAKSFIILQEENQWTSELQHIAKLEFQVVRFQHQAEVVQVLEWWRDLGLSNKLKFARNQPLKWYLWSITALTDPSLSKQRIDLIKPISIVYVIDDMFDVYGTLEDLALFTNVVGRWDIAATEQLPDYMKICFQALNNITNEISYKVYQQHGWNPVESLRKSWANLCNAFLVEAKWLGSGNLPNAEEYLKNGIVSTGVHVVLLHLLFLLGEGLNKENVELIDGNLGIVSSSAKILRLWDDLGSAKDENQDGHDGSYIKCYMKEHRECSEENARKHVGQIISDTWKQLNHACLFQNPFSPTFTKACLNVARMVPFMYSYDKNCRLPILEELMSSII